MFAVTLLMSYNLISFLVELIMRRGFNEATHGHNRKHGMRSGENYEGRRPRAYAAWVNMRQRCTNQKYRDYRNYGLRGITYCREWERFENFYADMGEPALGMSLDRIDNNGDYSKENCRWATRTEQNLNKRNNVRYEFKGKSMTLPEWSRELGIKRLTLHQRLIRSNWSIERAFSTPVGT